MLCKLRPVCLEQEVINGGGWLKMPATTDSGSKEVKNSIQKVLEVGLMLTPGVHVNYCQDASAAWYFSHGGGKDACYAYLLNCP